MLTGERCHYIWYNSMMSRRGAIIPAILLLCFVITACSAQEKPAGHTAATVCQIAGGVLTAGFGIWHYFVPRAYGWWDYLQDVPEELPRAIQATNFFFSTSLTLIGGSNVLLGATWPGAQQFNRYWLWGMVGLWTARTVFQAVLPQGRSIRGLAPAMLTAFAVTDALFLYAAIVLW